MGRRRQVQFVHSLNELVCSSLLRSVELLHLSRSVWWREDEKRVWEWLIQLSGRERGKVCDFRGAS